ncbi:MAG: metallophosphoesterase [Bacteriovoracaceae bacterium]|nr:metallophosphoesterase [Bacteriovoracaceae bacterium]
MKESNDSIFVFSDIHGMASELRLLINKLPLEDNSTLVFLGDYIDRGPQSSEVIDTILELKKYFKVITLMGNHEQMLLDFLEDESGEEAGLFIYNGGGATLESYKSVSDRFKIPPEHLAFYKSLQLTYETDDYFFVHAGLPDLPLDDIKSQLDEHKTTLLWIREPFFESEYKWSKTIIHGHTPMEDIFEDDQRINIDTACFFDNKLTALQLPQKQYFSVAKLSQRKHVYLKDLRSATRRSIRFEGSVPVYITVNSTLLQFETKNYSEFGMLIFDIINPGNKVLSENDIISGQIGEDGPGFSNFEGRVVRVQNSNEVFLYAIEFTKTPYEFATEEVP